MNRLAQSLLVMIAIGFVAIALPVHAQEQNVAQGELVKVDPVAQSIAIRTDTGAQMQFTYDDNTEVNGADDTVAGLGTKTGTLVTIKYEKEESKLVAKRIDIQKVDQAPPKTPSPQ